MAKTAEEAKEGGQMSETEATPEPSSTKVTFESVMPREEAISYFEAIVAGLKSGTLRIRQGEESLTLNPPAQLGVNVKAASKGEKEKISFEMTWRVPTEADLTISSD